MLLKFPTGAKKTVNDDFRLHNFIFNVTLQFNYYFQTYKPKIELIESEIVRKNPITNKSAYTLMFKRGLSLFLTNQRN